MLDAHYLFCPGVATDLEPFFAGRTTQGRILRGPRPRSSASGPRRTERLGGSLHDWLDRTVTGPVRFTNTFIPIEQRFLPPDESHAQFVLTQAADDWDLSDPDIDALVRFVTWQVLAWHHENRKAFQIAVGAEYFICDGKSIPRFQADLDERDGPGVPPLRQGAVRPDDGLRRPDPRGRRPRPASSRTSTPRATGGTTSSPPRSRRSSASGSRRPR